MRILHVTPYYHPSIGGLQHYVQAVSERLAARGHDVTVFTRQVGLTKERIADLPAHESINGVQIRRHIPRAAVPRWVRHVPGSFRLLRALFGADMFSEMCDGDWSPGMLFSAARLRPDVIMLAVADQRSYIAQFALFARLSRIPVVCMPLIHLSSNLARPVAESLSPFDEVITMTEAESHFIDHHARPASPRMHAIGAGVDPEHFLNADGSAIRARYGIGDRPTIAFVGRLSAGKGAVKVIEAMRHVWTQAPDARLLLTGHRYALPEEETRRLQAAIDGLSPAERARLVMIEEFSDEEKSAIFAACDVFAMPSVQESFGIVYLEAWMCRKPVVGARIEAIACVIDDERDGLLVDPDSSHDIANALLRLIRDPDLRRRMGERGHAKTVARFTWDRVTDAFERVYAGAAGA